MEDVRLGDLLLLLQKDEVVDGNSLAYSLDGGVGVLYLHLERQEEEAASVASIQKEKSRWLLLDHTEAQLLAKLQKEILRRKDAEASLTFLKQQKSRENTETVDNYEMRLSGESSRAATVSSLNRQVAHAQEELSALKERMKSQRADAIFKAKVANRVIVEQREKTDRLHMQIEDQHQAIIVGYEELESSKQRESILDDRHAHLLSAHSHLIAERNSLLRTRLSTSRDLTRAVLVAKESKKEVEAFKGAIERLLDVISREGEDDEEGREEDEEDETFEHSIISICK